jgi:hypothetical protein
MYLGGKSLTVKKKNPESLVCVFQQCDLRKYFRVEGFHAHDTRVAVFEGLRDEMYNILHAVACV